MRISGDRLLLAFGVIALAAAGGLAFYSRYAAFSGELTVGAGREEDIVTAPAETTPQPKTPGVVQGAPGRAIPFKDADTARNTISPAADYHVARLPFLVKMETIEVLSAASPADLLKIAGPGAEQRLPIKNGIEVTVSDKRYTVAGISKWSGLLRDPQGVPMAAVSVETVEPQARATVFIASGAWQTIEPGVALQFQWVENETAAKSAQLPGLESARWGVVDGSAANWFKSFTPGEGATLSNGTEVTLADIDLQHPTPEGPRPAIAVELQRGGEKSVVWVVANTSSADGAVRFEYPALLPQVFLVRAWKDGSALVTAFTEGQPAGEKSLQTGQVFNIDNAGVGVRLEQVLATAVPVDEKASTLWAAVIKTADGEAVTLRQGEAVRLGDYLIEYIREVPAPTVRYHMKIKGKDLTLDPNEPVRFGDWRLTPAGPSKEPASIALLAADYTPGRHASRILLAVGLAALLIRSAERGIRNKSEK